MDLLSTDASVKVDFESNLITRPEFTSKGLSPVREALSRITGARFQKLENAFDKNLLTGCVWRGARWRKSDISISSRGFLEWEFSLQNRHGCSWERLLISNWEFAQHVLLQWNGHVDGRNIYIYAHAHIGSEEYTLFFLDLCVPCICKRRTRPRSCTRLSTVFFISDTKLQRSVKDVVFGVETLLKLELQVSSLKSAKRVMLQVPQTLVVDLDPQRSPLASEFCLLTRPISQPKSMASLGDARKR